MTDFGSALRVFFCDPEGLEAAVVWLKVPQTLGAGRRPTESSVSALGPGRSPKGTLVTSP